MARELHDTADLEEKSHSVCRVELDECNSRLLWKQRLV